MTPIWRTRSHHAHPHRAHGAPLAPPHHASADMYNLSGPASTDLEIQEAACFVETASRGDDLHTKPIRAHNHRRASGHAVMETCRAKLNAFRAQRDQPAWPPGSVMVDMNRSTPSGRGG